jgi:hypothetical protein
MLSKVTSSSSGKLYAQNLAQASTQFKGKSIDPQGALSLLQTLIGGGQADQSGSQPAGGDLLGSLLGSINGGSGSGLGALVQAFLGGSGMGDSSHRSQSTQLVIYAFLQALSSLMSKE